jgi:TusA-related sulfurtransferase
MVEGLYGSGWFARIRPSHLAEDRRELVGLPAAHSMLANQIAALRVRCFAAFPDHEMFEIGTECAAVLVKLNELLARVPVGDVVHLVTDDGTAPIEMVRWSDETGQPVIDERREGNLFHFLVRKVS